MSRSTRDEAEVMVRTLAEALGHDYAPLSHRGIVPTGAWFIRRMDTERPLYVIAEGSGPHGGISHPLGEVGQSLRALGDAAYMARIAVGIERQGLGGRESAGQVRDRVRDALRAGHANDSAADAVEFVSDLVGWSAEDDAEGSS